MEKEKQEIIVKLYALRAGLSVMAQLREAAESIVYRIKLKHQEIKQVKGKDNDARRIERNEQAEYMAGIAREEEDISYRRRQYDNAVKSLKEAECRYKEEKKSVRIARLGVGFSWLSMIPPLCVVVLKDVILGQLDDESFLFLSIWGFIILGVLGGILKRTGGFSWFYMGRASISDYTRNRVICAKLDVNNTNSTLQRAEASLNSMKEYKTTRYKEIENKKLTAMAENEASREIILLEIEEIKKELAAQIDCFYAAHKAVQEEFSAFLDERDWGNIDLIIFNYETGRALDMRDALMQVDNERRNERLVRAVQDASKSISASIERGFGALQSALNTQFTRLDSRITGFTSQMVGIADASVRQTQLLGQKLDSLEESSRAQILAIQEASSAQQALLAKANTSSDELAASVDRIRQIENDRYYGIH